MIERVSQNDMERLLNIAQLVIAALLIAAVVLQNRGSDAGSIFGGGGGDTNVYTTKRGLERILMISTIVLTVLFMGVALANVLVR